MEVNEDVHFVPEASRICHQNFHIAYFWPRLASCFPEGRLAILPPRKAHGYLAQ